MKRGGGYILSSSGRGVWYFALSTCLRKTTSGSGSGLNLY